jgi:hypothetical protein
MTEADRFFRYPAFPLDVADSLCAVMAYECATATLRTALIRQIRKSFDFAGGYLAMRIGSFRAYLRDRK